ncbi:MAG: hypothetical protein N2039_09075 [Gemmataceae bacterium]|nr:hypothetical protein [Gemmataceae bacterium]
MIVLNLHAAAVNAVTFSADGRWLVSAGDDGDVWLTDLHWECGRHRLAWGAKFVFAVGLSPDSERLAVGTDSGVLILRHAEQGWRPMLQRRDHGGWVTSVRFDPSGDLLASTGNDGQVRLWDATRRRRRPWRTLLAPLGPLRCVRFSPDGRFVAAAGLAGLALWHPLRPEPCFVYRLRDAQAHSLDFSPDGRFLWIGTTRSILRLDTESAHTETIVSGNVNLFRCLQACPRSGLLLLGRDDGCVQVLDVSDPMAPVEPLPRLYPCHQAAVNGLAIHPDGEIAATAGDDNRVCLWPLDFPVSAAVQLQ